MSYEFYKMLHIIGFVTLFYGLGLNFYHFFQKNRKNGIYKLNAAISGIALLVIFVSGFGLMARLELFNMPLWILLKLTLWLIIGLAPIWIKKFNLTKAHYFIFPALITAAAYLAIVKPFSSIALK